VHINFKVHLMKIVIYLHLVSHQYGFVVPLMGLFDVKKEANLLMYGFPI
jgi:hypothetical protein